MALDELDDRLSAPTTRRTVVKTGAKLAYAAPLVAGTMKLSAHGTLAASPGPCSLVDPTCVQGIDVCVDQPGCYCRPTTEGDTFCSPAIICGDYGYCETSADCGAGLRCTLSACCGREPGSPCCPATGGICAPPCAVGPGAVSLGANTSPAL